MTDQPRTITVPRRQDRASQLGRAVRSTAGVTICLCVIWGLAFPVLKIGLAHVPPEILAAGRAVVASLVLLPFVLAGRRLDPGERRYVHRMGAILGLLNIAGLYGLQSWGIYYIPSGLAAMLLYAQPLFMALGARLWFGEHLDAKRTAGLILGWAGIALVLGGGRPDILGAALTLGGAAVWAAGSLVFKGIPSRVPVITLLFWQNAYGMVPLLVMMLILNRPVPWQDPVGLASVLYAALASVTGFGLLFVLLRRGDAAVVGARIFAVPIIGAALGIILLDEPLTAGLVVGGIGVAAGIRLVNFSETTHAKDDSLAG